MQRILKVKAKTVFTVLFFFFIIFCLSGGPLILAGYSGSYRADEVRVALPAPFFAGLLVIGLLGSVGAVKFCRDRMKVFLGLFMLLFCYVGIELFFWLVGGEVYFG